MYGSSSLQYKLPVAPTSKSLQLSLDLRPDNTTGPLLYLGDMGYDYVELRLDEGNVVFESNTFGLKAGNGLVQVGHWYQIYASEDGTGSWLSVAPLQGGQVYTDTDNTTLQPNPITYNASVLIGGGQVGLVFPSPKPFPASSHPPSTLLSCYTSPFFLLSLFLPRTSEMPTVAALTMSLSTVCAFPSSSQIPCHQRFPPVHPGTKKVIHLSISSTLFPVFLFSLTSSIFQSSLHIQFHNSSTTLSYRPPEEKRTLDNSSWFQGAGSYARFLHPAPSVNNSLSVRLQFRSAQSDGLLYTQENIALYLSGGRVALKWCSAASACSQLVTAGMYNSGQWCSIEVTMEAGGGALLSVNGTESLMGEVSHLQELASTIYLGGAPVPSYGVVQKYAWRSSCL